MRRESAAAAALAAAMVTMPTSPVGAQESPDQITQREARCQLTMARRLLRFADDSSRCHADCQADAGPSRSCGSFEADPITQGCLDHARGRVERPVLRRCSGPDCPECYFGGNCPAFIDAWLGNMEILTASNLATLYCDDAGSPDGLTSAERDCREHVLASGLRLTRGLRQCFLRCHKRLRRDAVAGTCGVGDLDGPAFDPSTQDCIDRVRARYLGTCGECPDGPECWGQALPFGCLSARDLLGLAVSVLTDETLCLDQPVCGDGRVSATEDCDPGATPDGCADEFVCDGSCTCQPLPDRCAEATVISPLGGAFGGNRTGPSTLEASCGGAGPEVVFQWTPQESGTATVDTCVGISSKQVSVREGDCYDPDAEIACAADACAGGTGVSFPVVAGTTYHLIVDGSGSGAFILSVTPPPSDPPVCGEVEAVLTLDFTPDPGEPVILAAALLDYPGPKLAARTPPATNLASPLGAFLTAGVTDVDPTDGFADRLDASLVNLFGSVPPGDFIAAHFDCRPGAAAPTVDDLSCTARISSDPISGVFTPVPCSVSSFTVGPPPGS